MARYPKAIVVRVPEDLHTVIRVYSLQNGVTTQDYVRGLILDDLEKRGLYDRGKLKDDENNEQ